MYRSSNLVRLPSCGGSWPLMRRPLMSRYFRVDILPNSGGIGPLRECELIVSVSNLGMFASSDGMDPEKRLAYRSRVLRLGRDPN